MEVSDKWCPQGWVFNNFAGTMDRETECTLASLLMTLCGQPAEGKSWHPEAAEQAWAVTPQEVHQGQVQGAVPGLGQFQAQVQAGQRMDKEQP